jgi:tRNA (pseudouridine54-N1)-methyltransferase
VTVLGDHLGFTEAEEEILELRGAVRVSLGPVPMLTSQCITIVQWLLDNE